ncbi:MAG: hypothetical protein IPI44_07690 [Sulfuritalea sp.]|nr:hypothetical protein [Sulfuritalea sp.]
MIAIIISLVGLASQTARNRRVVRDRPQARADVLRPLSPEHPDDETFPGLLGPGRPEAPVLRQSQNVAEKINARRAVNDQPPAGHRPESQLTSSIGLAGADGRRKAREGQRSLSSGWPG